MNGQIVFGIIFMVLGSGIGTYFIQKGRTKVAFESNKKLIEHINSLDSISRIEILTKADLNKEEIILLVNNQTKSSASEIISEVQEKFGLIKEELDVKGKQIEDLTEKVKPENRERENASLKLNWFISLLKEGKYSYSLKQEIQSFFEISKLELEYYSLIKSLFYEICGNHKLRNGVLRRKIAWEILASYPDEIDVDFFILLVNGEMTQLIYGDPKESAVMKNIAKAFEYIYSNNEDLESQPYFNSVKVFFKHVAKSEKISQYVYNSIKSKKEKLFIYKQFFINNDLFDENHVLNWENQMVEEFGSGALNGI